MCQWVEVHDLWRHFYPSYLVLHTLNRLLASYTSAKAVKEQWLGVLKPCESNLVIPCIKYSIYKIMHIALNI